jgi:hypothetical protein
MNTGYQADLRTTTTQPTRTILPKNKDAKDQKLPDSLRSPSNAIWLPSKVKRCYALTPVTLVTIPAIFMNTLMTSPSAAAGTRICNHSYHFTGLTSVSIQPAPFSGAPPLTFGVKPSSAGKRWCSTKYWSKSSFSRQRASSQSLKTLSS